MITKCLICGKIFTTFPSRIKINFGKYCSRKCFFIVKKSMTPWNKGKKLGFIPKGAFKKGIIPWNKGKRFPGIYKGKMIGHKFPKGNKIKWKGGRTLVQKYTYIYSPTHPFRNSGNYVFEHRLVMEKHIGRYLTKEEIVHHINEIRSDNRIENLMLFKNRAEHFNWHKSHLLPIKFC